MSYTIQYSPAAIRELDRVWAEVYGASQNVNVARKYIIDMLEKIAKERDFPKSGSPLNYEGRFTGYYFIIFKPYVVFFRAEFSHILVDRIVCGKSDNIRTILHSMNA